MAPWEEEVVLQGDGSADDRVGELRIRIRELPMADGVHASTGCQLWSGSIVLASELLRRQGLIAGKRVLEVGAGCGLLGIVAACLARWTMITDGDEEVVQNLEHNVRANESLWRSRASNGSDNPEVVLRRLDWDEVAEAGWPLEDRVEVIIASDVIYGHWGETMAQAMLNMLAPGGTILLAASEDRRSGIRAFKDHLGEAGFIVVETKLVVPLGTYRTYECRERRPGESPVHPDVVVRIDVKPGDAATETAPSLLTAPLQPGIKMLAVERAEPQAPLAEQSPAVQDAAKAGKLIWRVVGGVMRSKGIIVRSGCSGDEGKLSGYVGRLAHGALIEEIERTADKRRLRYTKLLGNGPVEGWVSFLSGKGASLLTQVCPAELE